MKILGTRRVIHSGDPKILSSTVAIWHPGFLYPCLKLLLKRDVWYKMNFYVDFQEKGLQTDRTAVTDVKRENHFTCLNCRYLRSYVTSL
jgi:hypothetical protein